MTPEVKVLVEAIQDALRRLPLSSAWDADRTALRDALKPFEPEKRVYRLAWRTVTDRRYLQVISQNYFVETSRMPDFLQWEGAAFAVEVPE